MSDDVLPDMIVGGFGPGVAGSVKYSCVYCLKPAWLAPSSQQMVIKNPTIKVMCLECYITNPAVPNELAPGVSTREEICDLFFAGSEEKADKFIADGIKIISDMKKRSAKIKPWKMN
jgi:hypothetical protein